MKPNAENPISRKAEADAHATDIERLAAESQDPRIKSPDEILSKLAPKKGSSVEPLNPESLKSIEIVKPIPPTGDRTSALSKELSDLRTRYEREITQWRDYERRIQDWRAQVVAIVQTLKRDAQIRQETVEELARCRAALKAREDELQRIRGAGRPNLKAVG